MVLAIFFKQGKWMDHTNISSVAGFTVGAKHHVHIHIYKVAQFITCEHSKGLYTRPLNESG